MGRSDSLLHAPTLILGETDLADPDDATIPASIAAESMASPPKADEPPSVPGSEVNQASQAAAEPTLPPATLGESPMDRADTMDMDGGDGPGSTAGDGLNELKAIVRMDPLAISMAPITNLVMREPQFPGWENPDHVIPLKEYLAPDFEKGYTPTQTFHAICPSIISWMQQLSQTPCETVWGMESQKGINAFGQFVDSCSRFKNKFTVARKTLDAAYEAAGKSLSELLAQVPPNPSKIQAKKDMLGRWLQKRHLDARVDLDQEQCLHDRANDDFLEQLGALAKEAFEQYQNEPALNEQALFAELDQQVDGTLETPATSDVPCEQAEKQAKESVPQTLGFEAMQQLVGEAFQKAGATIDAAQHEQLAKSLGEMFKNTVFPSDKPSDKALGVKAWNWFGYLG